MESRRKGKRVFVFLWLVLQIITSLNTKDGEADGEQVGEDSLSLFTRPIPEDVYIYHWCLYLPWNTEGTQSDKASIKPIEPLPLLSYTPPVNARRREDRMPRTKVLNDMRLLTHGSLISEQVLSGHHLLPWMSCGNLPWRHKSMPWNGSNQSIKSVALMYLSSILQVITADLWFLLFVLELIGNESSKHSSLCI